MLASMAGPDERTAGRAARIRPRTAGKERFRAPSAGIAARSVRGSSPTAAESSRSRAAKAPAVVSKSVTSDLSCSRLRSMASAVTPARSM